MRLLEVREGILEQHARGPRTLLPRMLDLLAQAQLQFARGLLGEGDRDNLVDGCPPFRERVDHAGDEFGRLAGACRRLDDERRVEVVPDPVAVPVVHQWLKRRAHFILRNSVSSSSGRGPCGRARAAPTGRTPR